MLATVRNSSFRESLLKEAARATAALEHIVDSGGWRVALRRVRRDKYFPLLAEVSSGGLSAGARLLELGLARRYHGGRREAWFDDAGRLQH